jgi:hypothetical protein
MVSVLFNRKGKIIQATILISGLVLAFFEPSQLAGFFFMGISSGMGAVIIFDRKITLEGVTNGNVFIHEKEAKA